MNPERFLHTKFPELQQTPEVASAVGRKSAKNRENIPNTPEERLGAYLSRLEEIFATPQDETLKNENLREFRLDYVKNKILDSAIPLRHKTVKDLPDNFFNLDRRIAREQGHGDVEITREMKSQIFDSTVQDQEASLGSWFDYLASSDATYPMWLKYFALRSVANMGDFDKKKHEFKKRSQFTRGVFPDLNREALAYVLDAVEKQYGQEPQEEDINDQEFQKLLTGANFAKLYVYAIEKVTPASQEQRDNIQGQWIKYDQGSDHLPLVKSLQGHGTGWCTAGESTAKAQLDQGDFYVYYSNDESGQPKIPRIAIRMQNDSIAEIRGIDPNQNMEPELVDIAKEKAQTLPGHESYEKKSSDMRQVTIIEKKIQQGEKLIRDELVFLYELNSTIEGFGYPPIDPRVKELRDKRDANVDMLIIFDCEPNQIAHNAKEINKDTKAYVGEWNIEVYQIIKKYPDIQYLYESFPDSKIFMQTLETDSKIASPRLAEEALKRKNIYISDWGQDILKKTEFSQESQVYELVQFTVKQLGFPGNATTQQIYDRAKELGLELCPAEVGPHLRLQYEGNDWKLIAMKQVSDRRGGPSVFSLDSYGSQLKLSGHNAHPGYEWNPSLQFVFLSRKLEN